MDKHIKEIIDNSRILLNSYPSIKYSYKEDGIIAGMVSNTILGVLEGIIKAIKVIINKILDIIKQFIKYLLDQRHILGKIADFFLSLSGEGPNVHTYKESSMGYIKKKLNVEVIDPFYLHNLILELDRNEDLRIDHYNMVDAKKKQNEIIHNIDKLIPSFLIEDRSIFSYDYIEGNKELYLGLVMNEADKAEVRILQMHPTRWAVQTNILTTEEELTNNLKLYGKELDNLSNFYSKKTKFLEKSRRVIEELQRKTLSFKIDKALDADKLIIRGIHFLLPIVIKDINNSMEQYITIKDVLMESIINITDEMDGMN